MSHSSRPESTPKSIRSFFSSRPVSTASSFAFTSPSLERPPWRAPAHHSAPSSPSATVQDSIYSHDESDPLLEAELEKDLQHKGEQIWESQSQNEASGGQRTTNIHRRGCVMPRASLDDEARWQRRVQDILGYEFRDIDLLEEALESQGSGVTVTGLLSEVKRTTNRHCLSGNKELAKVGHAAMVLVLMDQCYLFHQNDEETKDTIKRHTNSNTLYQIGRATTLQQYIRPHKPIRPSESKNVLTLVSYELNSLGSDAVREVSNGVRAIVGAVYFDSGYEAARRVMARLGLIIKLPER